MSAPQPPADGRPRDDEPRSGGDTSADGAAGTYEFHGEQLDFDPYRFGRPEEPAPTWGAAPAGDGSGGVPAPGDRWAPGGDPGTREVRPGDYWDGAGSHRGTFPPAGYVPPAGGGGTGTDPSSPPRVDLGKPGDPAPRDAWAPPTSYPSATPPPARPGAYPGAPGPTPGGSRNGLATAGLVLGIIGVVLAFVSWPGILVGLVGLGLAIPGLVKARRGAPGKGIAVAGVVLSAVAVVLGAVLLVVYLQQIDFACVERANGDISQAQECVR